MTDMQDVSESERRSLGGSAKPAAVIRTAALFLVTASLALGSCTRMKLEGPDLGEIYNRAARHHSSERNPIIVIPGILGTKLVDDGTGSSTTLRVQCSSRIGPRCSSVPGRRGSYSSSRVIGSPKSSQLRALRNRMFRDRSVEARNPVTSDRSSRSNSIM